MGISTHILDTTLGRPAPHVPVILEMEKDSAWVTVGSGQTDADGRFKGFIPAGHDPVAGTYRITFMVDVYFNAIKTEAFYPVVSIVFILRNAKEHHHVPLLLNPFGYSTYRGS